MHRLRPLTAVAVAALLLAPAGARAQTQFIANLTNSQENPPAVPTLSTGGARPASFGTATFTLNAAQTSLTMNATIFNIDVTGSQTADVNDNLTAAHIHAGANTPPTNNPVVWGFFGAPLNDNNPNDFSFTPFGGGLVGGTFIGKWDAAEGNNTTLAAQLTNIFEGRAYINFHTTQFPGGEIRGALQVVPEPSTYALMATGLAGVALAGWRRRRA